MAKILTADEFRKCGKGTVFAFGHGPLCLGHMLILDCIIEHEGTDCWGFYAANPIGVEGDNMDDMIRTVNNGGDIPIQTSSTKYMSYDGDDWSCFFVLSKSDWRTIGDMAGFD